MASRWMKPLNTNVIVEVFRVVVCYGVWQQLARCSSCVLYQLLPIVFTPALKGDIYANKIDPCFILWMHMT